MGWTGKNEKKFAKYRRIPPLKGESGGFQGFSRRTRPQPQSLRSMNAGAHAPAISLATTTPVTLACIRPRVIPAPSPMA